MNIQKNIIVIGGGAAGFFAAINSAIKNPKAKIIIIEKTGKILSKVKISGGGRCNVTNYCFDNNELVKNYPRGEKELKQVFAQFSVKDTIDWFERRNVSLKVEEDGRMFPESNSSETIVNCFLSEIQKYQIQVCLNEEVIRIDLASNGLEVTTSKRKIFGDSVICSIGGSNQEKNYSFLKTCGHAIEPLIPSLFTINLPKHPVNQLMGLSVRNGTVSVLGTKHVYTGPVLITHWGLSGPAVLKLSAFAAKDFFASSYQAKISVNWSGNMNEEELMTFFKAKLSLKTFIINTPCLDIPKRLWEYLVLKSGIQSSKPWNELGKKQLYSLVQSIINDLYEMRGKTVFKEEFVTAGGVSLKEINFKTMESKKVSHLFFCGEVLNIDGITGGFNFQNAWSTAWIASQNA